MWWPFLLVLSGLKTTGIKTKLTFAVIANLVKYFYLAGSSYEFPGLFRSEG